MSVSALKSSFEIKGIKIGLLCSRKVRILSYNDIISQLEMYNNNVPDTSLISSRFILYSLHCN